MKRAALEKLRTSNVWRAHVRKHRVEDGPQIACACEFQVGRFRKGQRIGGCSNARCWLCHSEKLSAVPTLRQQRSAITLAEGVAEIGRPAR